MKNFADLTEREVLAVAISSEEEDSRIYMTFAEDLAARYPDSAKLFQEMAEEERGHRHRLLEIYEARFGSHLPPRVAAGLRTLVWVLVLLTLVVLVVQGVKVMEVEGRSRTISLPVELPRSWFYSLPLTVSAVSMAFTTIYLIACELTTTVRRPKQSVSPIVSV